MLKAYRSLLPFLSAHRKQYLWGLLFLIITDAAQLYLPQLVRRAIDTVAYGRFQMRNVAIPAIAMIGAALLVAGGRFLWRSNINTASRQIEGELRASLFGHLQGLSSTFYGKNKTGDLMAHMTNDINAVRMATGIGFALAVDGIIMAVSVLTIMLSLDSRMALISLSPLPVLTVGVLFFSRIVGEQFTKVQEGFSRISDLVQESFSGVRVIKTFVKETAFVRKFTDANREYSQRNLRLVRSWGFFFPAVSFLAGLTSVLFLLIGGGAVLDGSMSAGEFTAFFSYLQMLVWPLLGAGFTVNMLQRAGASLKRINAIMEEEPDIRSAPPEIVVSTSIEGTVTFRNLSYTYPGSGTPALRGIDLEIPAGSVLGVLGRTGSGKSTLVNLLPRILDPPEGTLFIDGIDVRSRDLTVLRSAISMVPQENFLFSRSIRENVAFGNPGAPEATLREMVAVSTIDRDLAIFPNGWDTVVGERGVTLSGGQKQRVSISRALAADASIIIFDDALSSVDTETEDAILSKLRSIIGGKTVIIVSHRISTLKNADSIIVMEEGTISERGTHAELLSHGGFYADIHRLQQLEESIRRRR